MCRRMLLALVFAAAGIGCRQPGAGVAAVPAEPAITVEGSELVFAGPITRACPTRVRDALSAHRLSALRIDSGGGDVEAAMEIGALVQGHGLDVTVRGACLSSCANYVFPSGRRKFITDGSIVAWHGSPAHLHHLDRQGAGSTDPVVRTFNADLARRDAAFMRSIGVDPFVSWFGKLAPFDAPNFYALNTADMASFGIRDVVAPRDYGPGYLASLPTGLRTGITFVPADAETAHRLLPGSAP